MQEQQISARAPAQSVSVAEQLLRCIRFLTILSAGRSGNDQLRSVSTALHLFPVVGLLVGALTAVIGHLMLTALGSPLHAVGVVAAAAFLTGGLHLDGLADTFDGVFSWRSRERKLEIMLDSRLGTMGVLALVFLIMLKVGALLSLGPNWLAGALLAPVWGRWAGTYGILRFPSARESGTGFSVREHAPPNLLWYGALLALAPSFLLGGIPSLFLLASTWFITALTARLLVKSLGGLTGDTYGALSELAELTTLFSLLLLSNHSLW